MSRRRDPNLYRVSMMLNRDDYLRLQQLYHAQGASAVVRALMRAHLLRVDHKASQEEFLLPEIEIPLEDLEAA